MLLESEYAGNAHLADWLTQSGHPITPEDAMARFMGLAGADFIETIESWIGRALPEDFHRARAEEDKRAVAEGLAAVAGAVAFVESLPPDLPRAIASSSSSAWIKAHLDHLGLRRHFEGRIFSGREHVARGKPAPDIYIHAAEAIGIEIGRAAIVEDSPVGAIGALASGATVIGLCAGSHCLPSHAERLRALGVRHVASDFAEVADLLGLALRDGRSAAASSPDSRR